MAYKQYQRYNGYHIRDHGNQVRRYGISSIGQYLQTAAQTKQQTGLHRPLWSKFSKDNRRNGNKALSYDNDRAELVNGCQGYISAAKAG